MEFPNREPGCRALELWSKARPSAASRELYVGKTIPGRLLDPSRDEATDHETSCDDAAGAAYDELGSKFWRSQQNIL